MPLTSSVVAAEMFKAAYLRGFECIIPPHPVPCMPLDQPYNVTHGLQGLPSLLRIHWLRPIIRVQPQLIEREQSFVQRGQMCCDDGGEAH
jgi:hypothetical protein